MIIMKFKSYIYLSVEIKPSFEIQKKSFSRTFTNQTACWLGLAYCGKICQVLLK